MLAHRHAGPGDHDGRHRADVDRVAAIATGADDVDGARSQFLAQRHQRGRGQHGVEQSTELLRRLTLGTQGDDEADQLRRRGVAGQNRRHRRPGMRRRQVATLEQLGQERGPSTQVVE